MGEQSFVLDRLLRTRHHEERRDLAEMLVCDANDGAIEHRRKNVGHLLDFGRTRLRQRT